MLSERNAYTVAQWCAAWNLSRSTFYSMQRKGVGPEMLYVGNRALVTVEADRAWAEKMRAASAVAPRGRPAARDRPT